jgi:hypothetical protein
MEILFTRWALAPQVKHLIHRGRVLVTQRPPLYSSKRFVLLHPAVFLSLYTHISTIEVNIVYVRTARQPKQLHLLSRVRSFL